MLRFRVNGPTSKAQCKASFAQIVTSSGRTKQQKQVAAVPVIDKEVPEEATELPDDKLLKFERKGWVSTRRLLSESQVKEMKKEAEKVITEQKLLALQQRVRVLNPKIKDPATTITTIEAAKAALKGKDLGFLQFFNTHRSSAFISSIVRGKVLAGTAAQLLGVPRVRLYQDCIFLKEPGYTETNWHSDLRMAPFDTNSYVTAWIPMRPVVGTEDDSGLLFASGSHRDFALPFWHDLRQRGLDDRDYKIETPGKLELGDVTWHHGWTLHCAGAQPKGSKPRMALAVAYFADGARLLPRKSDPSVYKHMLHDEDAESYERWASTLPDGGVASHYLLPLVYPPGAAAASSPSKPRGRL